MIPKLIPIKPYLVGLLVENLQPIDPDTLPRRPIPAPDLRSNAFWFAFMAQTRRYHQLTRHPMQTRYARGLDSKPEEMA
jgi:hypothetical protein